MSGLSPILASRRPPLLLASSHVHRRLPARTWPLRHPAQLSRGAVDDPAGIGAHTHLLEAGQRSVVISLQRTGSAGRLGQNTTGPLGF